MGRELKRKEVSWSENSTVIRSIAGYGLGKSRYVKPSSLMVIQKKVDEYTRRLKQFSVPTDDCSAFIGTWFTFFPIQYYPHSPKNYVLSDPCIPFSFITFIKVSVKHVCDNVINVSYPSGYKLNNGIMEGTMATLLTIVFLAIIRAPGTYFIPNKYLLRRLMSNTLIPSNIFLNFCV